jgi:hypothetical protein
MNKIIVIFFLFVILTGCITNDDPSKKGGGVNGSGARLFPGMGDHHRKITTSSKLAQQYFDQGLVFAFAFNHDEAIRSFTEAARLDPDAAMP